MSGQDGNRGYYYQAVVAILNACTNEDWSKISVEYSTDDEKVDIALLNEQEHVLNAIQVKSSINQFSTLQIKMWLKDITDDVLADNYELILIGSCEKTANTFIKSIDKYYSSRMDKEATKCLGNYTDFLNGKNIKIKLLPFDMEYLYGIIRDSLNKFISSLSYTLAYSALDQLSHALASLHMFFATNGEYVSREEYIDKIKKWLEISCSGIIGNGSTQAFHEIKSFDYSTMSLSADFKPIRVIDSPAFLSLREKHIQEGRRIILKITEIKIDTPSKDSSEHEVNAEYLKKRYDVTLDTSSIERISEFMSKKELPAEIRGDKRADFCKSIKKYWDISVPDDFFYVGNLTKNNFSISGTNYNGSDIEKEKNTLIESLFCEIAELEMLDQFADLIKNLYYFPLCIYNSGKVSDTNLTVALDLSNTSIQPFIIKGELNKEEMELLNDLSDWLVDEDIIASIFEASNNGAVTAEVDVRANLHSVPPIPANIFGRRKKYNIGDFLERFFYFQAKPDDFCNVSYEIKSLRAAESKWLSPFLYFVPKSKEFNIRYSILSEKLGEKIEGVIEGRLE